MGYEATSSQHRDSRLHVSDSQPDSSIVSEGDLWSKTSATNELFRATNSSTFVSVETVAGHAMDGAEHTVGTQGDVVYAGAGGDWALLSPSTEGFFLQTVGTGNNPKWTNIIPSNIPLLFGTGGNNSISSDGTDLFIDLRASGGGDLLIALGAGFPSPDPNTVHIWRSDAGAVDSDSRAVFVVERAADVGIQLIGPTVNVKDIIFGEPGTAGRGRLRYYGSTHGVNPDAFGTFIGGSLRILNMAAEVQHQQATTYSTTTGLITFSADGGHRFTTFVVLNDNVSFVLGTNSDSKFILRPNGLAANIESTNVILGDSVHQGFDDNTLVLTNITDGDVIGLVTVSGDSKEWLNVDASAAHLYLGHGMIDVTVKTDSGDVNLAPAGDVVMGSDVFIEHDTNAGLTAGTTQTQADGLALTTEINEIATVANDGDTVTMPVAAAGRRVVIINNGANTLQIFPASGDNIGAGVDVSRELESNEVVDFIAYDGTNWHVEASTETLHAQMFDSDNTDAYVINDAGGDQHAYHTNGLAAGPLTGWTFDAGGAGTSFPIASIADGADTGVDIAVTTTGAHGLAVGDIISQTNLANAAYVGFFIVKAIISATVYEVAAVFTADGTGTMDQAAVLTSDVGSGGDYLVQWSASATSATNNETFDFAIHVGAAHQNSTNTRRKFGTAGDVGAMSGVSIITIADSDKVSFMITNTDSIANLTMRNFTLVLTRL